MRVPTFRVKPTKEAQRKTLANIPEWTLVECSYSHDMYSLVRFRVGDFAYGGDGKDKPPLKQSLAREYIIERVIGQIVCD